MPWIDVTDILADPMIAGEAFQVLRRHETVNSYGESTIATTTYSANGSITPTGDNSLVREDAFQSQAKTIKVVTSFMLQGQAEDAQGNKYQPDLILWKGDYYIVRTLNDYSSYGAGMIEAECSSIDWDDEPPQENG